MADQTASSCRARVSAIAPIVLAFGLFATAVAAYSIWKHEQREIGWATKLAADAIRIDLTTDVQWLLFGLDRLALLWDGPEPTQPLWTKNAELYIQHRPGAIAVEWISADRSKCQAVYRKGLERSALAFGGVPASLMNAAAEAKVAMFSGTVDLPDGSKQWSIAYPVYRRGQLLGFVVSFFDFEKSLGYIVEDLEPLDFSFVVSQGEQHLFLKPGGSRKHEAEWGTTADIPLPGGKWQVRVWPNPTVVDRIRSNLPPVTLITGSFLSMLLAFIVHLQIIASRTARRIQSMNAELTMAHDQLETRVQERTAELGKTNVLLGREIEEHRLAEESLRELNSRLFHLQDEERRRIARELHDGATQGLVALGLNIESFRELAKDNGNFQTVDECAKLVQQCTTELRTISYLLHPPLFDELGLEPALRSYVDGFSARSGIQVNLALEQNLGRFGHDTELTIFRVVQEALANVHRHSRSRTAAVSISRNVHHLKLDIVDEGRGMAPELLQRVHTGMAGVGTAAMYERIRLLGGHLEISSSNTGTCVRALLPFTKPGTAVKASAA